MQHKIHIVAERLTDGSLVYNVHFRDASLPAITEKDALALADKIAAAINDHSNDEADVNTEFSDVSVRKWIP